MRQGDDLQPGQAFHFNYSFEYEFFKNFRGAVAGYYLKQLTDDEVNGNSVPDTKEQVFAIGPAVFWAASPNFFLGSEDGSGRPRRRTARRGTGPRSG